MIKKFFSQGHRGGIFFTSSQTRARFYDTNGNTFSRILGIVRSLIVITVGT